MRLAPLFVVVTCSPLGGQQAWPVPNTFQRPESAPQCRSSIPSLTADSIGPIRRGQNLDELQAVCPEAVRGWKWAHDGYQPALYVQLGAALVTVELRDTLPESGIYRIEIQDAVIRTTGGLGVGVPVSRFVAAWGAPSFVFAPEDAYMTFSGQPYSVRIGALDWEAFNQIRRTEDWRSLPPTAVANLILVIWR